MIKLDWQKALENVDGSEELLLELAKLFIETKAEVMGQISTAIANFDAPSLHRAAHNLKGSARIFAAGEAVDQAMRLEVMGADGDLRSAAECFPVLERTVDELTTALGERIGRAGAGERNGR